MLKRLAIVLSIAALVVVISEPRNTVHSTIMTDAEMALVNESANNDDVQAEKKGGNRLVKVVTFPFKAVGRLFGFGKKQDPNKLERLSEKDVKKFESAKVAKVTDARSTTAAPTTDGAAPAPVVTDDTSKLDPDQALARIYLADGRKAFNNGDANAAIAALTHAISLDKKLYEAHNLLGIAYESKGLRNNALESLKASLKGDNDQPEHLNDYGYLLMRDRDFEGAVKYLKRAVKAKPDERFLNNLALAQVELGKFDDAYKSFERAVGEFQGRLNIATRLKRLGWNKKAIEHLEKARALQPESMAVLADLVVLYQRTGKTEQAEEANKALITLRTSAEATPKQ
ncbi:MAG TPA: tetratricopeptide repeat protein [Pyrinomonadaceae bacterium]|nr:tetratricopeptide repeat protein [Pyrinomonadaceae bacterium]